MYEWLGVREYFVFDPLGEYLRPVLRGFRLTDGSYGELKAQVTEGGLQFTSEVLGLFLRAEDGELQLVDRATGEQLLPPPELAEALRAAKRQIQEARRQAQEAERRAQDEAAARQAAEARAEALEAELARLQAELARRHGDQNAR